MFTFARKQPIAFEVIVTIVAFILAGILTAVCSVADVSPELASSIARIIVGIALIVIFRKTFLKGSPASGITYALPALLSVGWNLVYNLSSGSQIDVDAMAKAALITALAPAIFEEVLFRGIFVSNLKASGKKAFPCVIISAVFFSLLHATNLVGQDAITVALQVCYSLVIGLMFGAIYLKNGSLSQVMLAHFLLDYSNRIYFQPATSSSVPMIVAFIVLLAVEAVYSLWLTSTITEEN